MENILLILFALTLSGGQILFKYASLTAPKVNKALDFLMFIQNIYFWAAITLYGFSTLLWIYILQIVPLSKAYVFVAIGFITVPLLSRFLFNEILTPIYFLGSFLIISGVMVIAVSMK